MISSFVDDCAHIFFVSVDLCHCLDKQLKILKNLTIAVGGKMNTMWLSQKHVMTQCPYHCSENIEGIAMRVYVFRVIQWVYENWDRMFCTVDVVVIQVINRNSDMSVVVMSICDVSVVLDPCLKCLCPEQTFSQSLI